MKKVLTFVLAFSGVFSAMVSLATAGSSAEDTMKKVFSNLTSVPSEIEISKIKTTNWGGDEKVCTTWARRNPDGKMSLMFVLNRGEGLDPKPDGAVINSRHVIDPPIVFLKRRQIKEKSSGFDDKSNGTELNYFDLMRLGGESVSAYSFSSWDKQPDARISGKMEYAVKAVPKSPQSGDYSYRVFFIGTEYGMPVARAIECFDGSGKMVKLQLNSGFEKLDANGQTIVRERIRKFITSEGETDIQVVGRNLNADFGVLDENALKNGQP